MKVWGVGPRDATVAIFGPYPGKQEDQTGIPFSPGDEWIDRRTGEPRKRYTAGDELNRLLDLINLPRKSVYLSNVIKWWGGPKYVYTQADYEAATPFFASEVQRVSPSVVVTMGREVTRMFMGDVDVTDVEGIPWWFEGSDCYPCPPAGTVVFPLVHIAAGMRNPELSPYVVNGFLELGRFLNGEVEPRTLYNDPYPNPVYRLLTGSEVWDILGAR